jgi:hypothetical protein
MPIACYSRSGGHFPPVRKYLGRLGVVGKKTNFKMDLASLQNIFHKLD